MLQYSALTETEIAYFFRDPERSCERGGGLVIAPADGKVVMITEVDEPAFLHAKALAMTGLDVLFRPEVLTAAREDFRATHPALQPV